jgi:hypothetical protein
MRAGPPGRYSAHSGRSRRQGGACGETGQRLGSLAVAADRALVNAVCVCQLLSCGHFVQSFSLHCSRLSRRPLFPVVQPSPDVAQLVRLEVAPAKPCYKGQVLARARPILDFRLALPRQRRIVAPCGLIPAQKQQFQMRACPPSLDGGLCCAAYQLPVAAGLSWKGKKMNKRIWKHGKVTVTLTTESPCSHYGIPSVRIDHPTIGPGDSNDFGPADIAPRTPDEAPGTVAALVCAIHRARPLSGEALDGAKVFLSQWPDGPQL